MTWCRHQMETFSALLVICAGNSPVPGEFLAQRPVTRSFDVSFDLRMNKRLNNQSWGWWFGTPSWSLWRQCNGIDLSRDEPEWLPMMPDAHTANQTTDVHSCSKVMGFFFLRWQNMVFIFKVQTWNFVCGIRRSFAFTMENILSVWYTATPGWTFTFGKVWKNALSKRCNTGKDMAIFSCFLRWQILK